MGFFVWRFDRDVLYARDGTQALVRPGVRTRAGNFDLVFDRDPRCAVGQTTHRAVRIKKIKNKKNKKHKKIKIIKIIKKGKKIKEK